MGKEFYLKNCPCCGNSSHIEDKTINKTGHKGTVYGRVVCDKNIKGSKDRCYIKTVCGELDKVILSWNTRGNNGKES